MLLLPQRKWDDPPKKKIKRIKEKTHKMNWNDTITGH